MKARKKERLKHKAVASGDKQKLCSDSPHLTAKQKILRTVHSSPKKPFKRDPVRPIITNKSSANLPASETKGSKTLSSTLKNLARQRNLRVSDSSLTSKRKRLPLSEFKPDQEVLDDQRLK